MFLEWIPQKLFETFLGRRRLQVLVHAAYFQGSPEKCYFVNVTNTSHNRDLEITHVWFQCPSGQVPALQPSRPLPKRLKPDETWETWVAARYLPSLPEAELFRLGRVRLSTGDVVASKYNAGVPHYGTVPGGPIGGSENRGAGV
jgi:hypothetical protein